MSLKYYRYISDTKLNMLYDQIKQPFWKKLSAKVGVNLGYLQTEWTQELSEVKRQEKLDTVVEHIQKNKDVGNLKYMKSYFEGEVSMWIALGGNIHSPSVLFVSDLSIDPKLVLTCSAKHMIGYSELSGQPEIGMSSVEGFLSSLEEHQGRILSSRVLGFDYRQILSVLEATRDDRPLPLQKFEFLAKHLLTLNDKESNGAIYVGSPIYVAAAE